MSRFFLLIVIIKLISCQSLEKNPKPCSKTPVDLRFDLKNNSHFFDKGTYWVYEDIVSGKIDSLVVVESKFFDRVEDGCTSVLTIRSSKVKLFSSYNNGIVTWSYDHFNRDGPNGQFKIANVNQEEQIYYLWYSGKQTPSKKVFFFGQEYQMKYAYSLEQSIPEIWHAHNIGIVNKIIKDSSGIVEDWQLIRYKIVRN